ncbi:MAG: hypothetical protein GIKADHBN_01799 [Phycisphaerales bacterium]|nr:hypothetical protein [Phycisphaerales bacterium]
MSRVMSRVLSAACAAVACAGLAQGAWAQSADGKAVVRTVELKGAIAERPSPFGWLFEEDNEPTLRTIVDALHKAGEEDQTSAVVIRLKDAELNASQVEEIGSAMKALREAGKKVCVYAEAYGPTELMLGSYADEVIAQDGGPVMLPGIHMEEMFLADTLAWIGIKADMVQVGDYKGASEQMARSAPSPQWDQNISALLDSMYGNMRSKLKEGRGLSDQELDKAMSELWLADAADAKAAGVVDTVIDLPGLESHLQQYLDAPISWGSPLLGHKHGTSLDASNPFALFSKLAAEPDTTPDGPTIAVLHIDGAIVDGESGSGGLLSGGESVGSRTIRNALEDIRDQDMVKGVVVRINSPGGSATASEVIWQGLRRVAERKPVWVSVGSMAASGGYYCAVGGDRIFVDPSSIVGSIGVVGGRMALDGVYEKLKINVVSRSRGPRADMFRTTGAWTPEELAIVRSKMTSTYDLFTRRVSAGRPGIDLSKVAEGRLFTGDRAVELKMADKIGGLRDAIGALAAELNLDEYEVQDYPAPKPLNELVSDMLGGFIQAPRTGRAVSPVIEAARAMIGERAWSQLEAPMEAFMQMRDEPVLLVSPKALIFR